MRGIGRSPSLLHRANGWRPRTAAAVAVLALAVCVASAASASTASARRPARAAEKKSSGSKLVEAVVTAFTGPESFIGGVLTAGTYPAVYEINAAGGVFGHDFTVDTVDTRGDPADALPLVERFLGATSNVAGVVGTDGATANQLLPVFNSHKITITSDVGSSNFDHTNLKYFWRLIAPDPVNGLAMAEWAKHKGYTRVAYVFGTDTTAQTDLPGIEYGVKHLHLNVVANISLTARPAVVPVRRGMSCWLRSRRSYSPKRTTRRRARSSATWPVGHGASAHRRLGHDREWLAQRCLVGDRSSNLSTTTPASRLNRLRRRLRTGRGSPH